MTVTGQGQKADAIGRGPEPEPVGRGRATGAVARGGSGALDLARLGVRRAQDLALHLPLRYEDETRVQAIGALHSGEFAQIEGVVTRCEVVARGRRMLHVDIADGTGEIGLRFFNFYPSQLRQLAPGRRVRALGDVHRGLFGMEMAHPRYRPVAQGEPLPQRLTPVYPTAAGIGQAKLRAAVLEQLRAADWPETVPQGWVRALRVPSLMDALRLLHEPPPGVSLAALEDRSHIAWQRVIFDELLAQQLSLKRARAARADRRAHGLPDRGLVQRLIALLPFTLTGAQQRAWHEVSEDLAREQPMNRLLQGDVGSGKTVIAALAAAQAIGSGFQAAFMAPTEILAEQHARKLMPWMQALGVRCAWLAGSLKSSEKKSIHARAAAGEIDLLVGTHALIADGVQLPNPGVSIVDEQHRFGVAQRLALRGGEGSERLPHQLMMSATPIPRTLAMSYYADLDVSVIDELPPGRRPVVTRLLSESRRDALVGRVKAAALAGRQAYWVCPLIEESAPADGDGSSGRGASSGTAARPRSRRQLEALELQTAIDTHARLATDLAPVEVGLVHGRLSGAQKKAVMQAFSDGSIQVLVATTVIEVGVDVPNASLMIIEHAERFGLAQLHQLRGRVGRGAAQSVCVLLFRAPLSPAARQRLQTMQDTTDGFRIAAVDLELRGPGEFLGARQSGLPMLRFADLERDEALVERARECADEMLREPTGEVDAHLERWLGGREEFLRA